MLSVESLAQGKLNAWIATEDGTWRPALPGGNALHSQVFA